MFTTRNTNSAAQAWRSHLWRACSTGLPNINRRDYSFRVFDDDFTRAVLIARDSFYIVGEYHDFEFGTVGLPYVKDQGVWRKHDEESFSHGEGVYP